MKKINLQFETKKALHSIKKIGSDADRDWKLAFSLFIISLVVLIAFEANIFFDTLGQRNDEAMGTSPSAQFINAKNLGDVLAQYDARADDYQKLASTTLTFADPR